MAPDLEVGERVGSGLREPIGWVRFIAPYDGLFAADTFGSAGDPAIAVFTSCASAEPVAAADDSRGLQARVAFEAAAGQSRWIRVTGSGALSVRVGASSLVTGRVTDLDGQPIPAIRVDVQNVITFATFGATSDVDGTYSIAVPSGSAGNYVAFTQIFSPQVPFLNAAFPDLSCAGVCPPEDATPFSVPASSTVEGIDLALRRGSQITGRVRADGELLGGARVTAFDEVGRVISEVFSDDSGRYLVGGLLPGSYRLSANGPSTTGEVWPGVPCPLDCDPLAGDAVTVAPEGALSGVDFALERKGSISVRLTDSQTGATLPLGLITLFRASGQSLGTAPAPTFGGLEVGTYFVRVESTGYSRQLWPGIDCFFGCDPLEGTPVQISALGETVEIVVPLDPLGSLSGQVTEESSGNPVLFAEVFFETPLGSASRVLTAADGSWLRTGLPASDDYRLVFEGQGLVEEAWDDLPCPATGCSGLGDPVSLGIGEDLTDFDAALAPRGSISGQIFEVSGQPASRSVRVRLHLSNGQFLREILIDAQSSASAAYRFDGLQPGSYFLTTSSIAYRNELWDDLPCPSPLGCDVTAGTPIVVTSGAETAADFTLERTPTLAGRVTAAASGEGVRSTVALYDSSGSFTASVFTDDDGFYEAAGLEPGTYTALARGNVLLLSVLSGGQACAGGIPSGCAATDGVPFEISTGLTTMDFALPRAGRIAGRLLEPGDFGVPLSANISLFRADGSLLASQLVAGGSTTFSFERLEAGTYFALADFARAFEDELWQGIACPALGGGCDPTSGTPIVVQRGATEVIEFTARPRGSISGTVQSRSTGEPIEPTAVVLYSSLGLSLATEDPVNGEFRFVGLSEGVYFLGTTRSPGFIDQIFGGEACEPDPCDPTSGLGIAVEGGEERGPFDLILDSGPGFSVEVRSQADQPIVGATIDLWRGTGEYLRPFFTDASGRAEIPLEEGLYLLSTDNGQGLIDQVWSEDLCPDGPAFLGRCDLFLGTPVDLTAGESLTEIAFRLEDPAVLFSDTFESGGLEAWDAFAGEPSAGE